MTQTLMMVGIGDLAGLILNMLAQEPLDARLVLAGRNIEEMKRRRNLALLFAAQLGRYPRIDVVKLDLMNPDQAAETLQAVRPTLIFNTATLQSWRMITYLPPEVFKALDEAQFGPWLPMHLVPAYRLMQAVRAAGLDARVVNAAFPDAVGAVLKGADLAPTIGIGNVANIVPALRGAIGLLHDRPIEAVRLRLFTQHYLSHRIPATGDSGGASFHLTAEVDGQDVTGGFDPERAFSLVRTEFQRTGGAFRQLITASSAVSVLRPLLTGAPADVHAPAPGGLPGGYAVRLERGEIRVNLPEGLSLEAAIALNQDCQRLDGIDRIDADGTVHFTEREMAIMKQMLNYDCPVMPLAEAEDRAAELGAKYREFAEQYR